MGVVAPRIIILSLLISTKALSVHAQHQTKLNEYWDSMGNYQGIYDAYTGGYAENQGQAGMIMPGN